jgi:hypothetical protein
MAGAPAENARILMEQGVFHSEKSVSGWRHAWKEVFLRTESPLRPSSGAETRVQQIREMREVREWVREVREMAGRGEGFNATSTGTVDSLLDPSLLQDGMAGAGVSPKTSLDSPYFSQFSTYPVKLRCRLLRL